MWDSLTSTHIGEFHFYTQYTLNYVFHLQMWFFFSPIALNQVIWMFLSCVGVQPAVLMAVDCMCHAVCGTFVMTDELRALRDSVDHLWHGRSPSVSHLLWAQLRRLSCVSSGFTLTSAHHPSPVLNFCCRKLLGFKFLCTDKYSRFIDAPIIFNKAS